MDYRNAFDMTASVAVITGGEGSIGLNRLWRFGHAGRRLFLRVENRSALDAAVKRLAETGVNTACNRSNRRY